MLVALAQTKRNGVLNASLEKTAWSTIGLDRYRKYDRPPFLKPETTQQEFYSEALKGLLIACGSARKLWLLAGDIRFQDGRSPGFIYNPTHRALVHAT